MTYIIIFIVGFIFLIFTLWQNNNPKITKYLINKKVSKDIKILQISDLHNYIFGKNNKNLKKLIVKDYDFIFITGDLMDRRYPNFEVIDDFLKFLDEKYKNKVFFSSGNHEKGIKDYSRLKKILSDNNVKILDNSKVTIGDFDIIGIEDPSEYINISKKVKKDEVLEVKNNLEKLVDKNRFSLVLSHQPRFFDLYTSFNIDVVFTGHTHGGQFRLFNKGFFAPGEGLLPKYDGGIFEEKNTVMINSRGLGNNHPLIKRIFNRPEIVEVIIENL